MLRNAWQLPAPLFILTRKSFPALCISPFFIKIGNFHLTKRLGETMMEIGNWKRYR